MKELIGAPFRVAGIHIKRKSITAFGRHFVRNANGGVMLARGAYLGHIGLVTSARACSGCSARRAR